MHTGEGAARSQWRPQAPGLSCPSSACARDPASPALPRAVLKTATIRHPLGIPASGSLLYPQRPLHAPLPTWPESSQRPQRSPGFRHNKPHPSPSFLAQARGFAGPVTATSRTPRTSRRAPSPFADGRPQAQRPAAPRGRPRGKAEAEGGRAHWPGPQPWAPAPPAPPPPSCRGLIQACGKRTWLAGTGRPQGLWDALMLQMRPWAPALGGFDELAKSQFSVA